MSLRFLVVAGSAVAAILRIIGSVLYQPDDGERVPTWSIRRREARLFFLLLYSLWIAAAIVLAYAQYSPTSLRVLQWASPPPHIGDGTAYIVLQRFGNIVVPLTAVALVLTPVLSTVGRLLMSLSQFINEKILDPIIDAKIVAPNADKIRAAVAARVAEEVTAQVTEEVTAQVTEEVTAQVTEEVTARTSEQWAAWIARRDEALAQGLEFNEPRPDQTRPTGLDADELAQGRSVN